MFTTAAYDHRSFCASAVATLSGSVILQGRAQGTSAYQVPLRVTFYQPGTSAVMATATATTISTGGFGVTGLAPGSYDIEVKHAPALSRIARTVSLGAGNNPVVSFGVLLTGDVNDSNFINLSDYNAMRSTFLLNLGDAGYDARADLNGSGFVNLSDYNLLRTNFLLEGPLPATAGL